MPTLSLIMIVKDEADCLGECLASVRGIVNEMVVVDTGSRDETISIAESFGAKVRTMPWPGDFSVARNASLASASGDWLLHLDADEVMDTDSAAMLRELVELDGAGADALEVTVANYCNDPRAWRFEPCSPDNAMARGFAGFLPVPLLRVFRNRRGFSYREAIHENITQSVIERGGRIRRVPEIVIHHYGYRSPSETPREKLLFYLELTRKKMAAHPEDVKALHDFAEQALACGETAEAERACRRALEIAPLDLDSATTLANILLNRGDLAEARRLLEGLEAAGAGAPHVLTALGAIACREGRLDEAETRLQTVLAHEPRHPMARLYLARVHDRRGAPEHARRELELLRDEFPALPEFARLAQAHNLRREGERLAQTGFPEQALEAFVAALRLDPEDPYTHNGAGVVAHALGDRKRARQSFRRALQLAHGLPEAEENLRAV
jgi:Flp pilus assembly protein TadD